MSLDIADTWNRAEVRWSVSWRSGSGRAFSPEYKAEIVERTRTATSGRLESLANDRRRRVPHRGREGVRRVPVHASSSLYDLRHSHASVLATQGVRLLLIGRVLGHTAPATTARYAHPSDDPVRRAIEAAGDRIGAGLLGRKLAKPRAARRAAKRARSRESAPRAETPARNPFFGAHAGGVRHSEPIIGANRSRFLETDGPKNSGMSEPFSARRSGAKSNLGHQVQRQLSILRLICLALFVSNRDSPVLHIVAASDGAFTVRLRRHSGSSGNQLAPLMWLPPSTKSVFPVR